MTITDLPFEERVLRTRELAEALVSIVASRNPIAVEECLRRVAADKQTLVSEVRHGLHHAVDEGQLVLFEEQLFLPGMSPSKPIERNAQLKRERDIEVVAQALFESWLGNLTDKGSVVMRWNDGKEPVKNERNLRRRFVYRATVAVDALANVAEH